MARPNHHTKVGVHGDGIRSGEDGTKIHFVTSDAHLKEWNGLVWKYTAAPKHNVKYRAPHDFFAQEEDNVGTYFLMDSHPIHRDGQKKSVLIHHDSHLREWMQFVASGCKTSSSSHRNTEVAKKE